MEWGGSKFTAHLHLRQELNKSPGRVRA